MPRVNRTVSYDDVEDALDTIFMTSTSKNLIRFAWMAGKCAEFANMLAVYRWFGTRDYTMALIIVSVIVAAGKDPQLCRVFGKVSSQELKSLFEKLGAGIGGPIAVFLEDESHSWFKNLFMGILSKAKRQSRELTEAEKKKIWDDFIKQVRKMQRWVKNGEYVREKLCPPIEEALGDKFSDAVKKKLPRNSFGVEGLATGSGDVGGRVSAEKEAFKKVMEKLEEIRKSNDGRPATTFLRKCIRQSISSLSVMGVDGIVGLVSDYGYFLNLVEQAASKLEYPEGLTPKKIVEYLKSIYKTCGLTEEYHKINAELLEKCGEPSKTSAKPEQKPEPKPEPDPKAVALTAVVDELYKIRSGQHDGSHINELLMRAALPVFPPLSSIHDDIHWREYFLRQMEENLVSMVIFPEDQGAADYLKKSIYEKYGLTENYHKINEKLLAKCAEKPCTSEFERIKKCKVMMPIEFKQNKDLYKKLLYAHKYVWPVKLLRGENEYILAAYLYCSEEDHRYMFDDDNFGFTLAEVKQIREIFSKHTNDMDLSKWVEYPDKVGLEIIHSEIYFGMYTAAMEGCAHNIDLSIRHIDELYNELKEGLELHSNLNVQALYNLKVTECTDFVSVLKVLDDETLTNLDDENLQKFWNLWDKQQKHREEFRKEHGSCSIKFKKVFWFNEYCYRLMKTENAKDVVYVNLWVISSMLEAIVYGEQTAISQEDKLAIENYKKERKASELQPQSPPVAQGSSSLGAQGGEQIGESEQKKQGKKAEQEREEQDPGIFRGLPNGECYCYLNTALQSLYDIDKKKFRKRVLESEPPDEDKFKELRAVKFFFEYLSGKQVDDFDNRRKEEAKNLGYDGKMKNSHDEEEKIERKCRNQLRILAGKSSWDISVEDVVFDSKKQEEINGIWSNALEEGLYAVYSSGEQEQIVVLTQILEKLYEDQGFKRKVQAIDLDELNIKISYESLERIINIFKFMEEQKSIYTQECFNIITEWIRKSDRKTTNFTYKEVKETIIKQINSFNSSKKAHILSADSTITLTTIVNGSILDSIEHTVDDVRKEGKAYYLPLKNHKFEIHLSDRQTDGAKRKGFLVENEIDLTQLVSEKKLKIFVKNVELQERPKFELVSATIGTGGHYYVYKRKSGNIWTKVNDIEFGGVTNGLKWDDIKKEIEEMGETLTYQLIKI